MGLFARKLESVVVLSVFEFLLAGLVCTVLVCAAWKTRNRSSEGQGLLVLGCAFLLLSSHFLFDVFDWYVELSNPAARLHSPALKLFVEALETMAYALLLAYYRPEPGSPRRAALAGLIAVGPVMLPVVNWFLLATLLIGFLRQNGASWFAASPVLAATLSSTCRLLQASPKSAWSSYAWGLEHLLILVSLVLFALVVERRARSLYVSIFVRLNLIFLVIAGALVLVVTHAERTQLTRFEETHLGELSEFLRGQALRSYTLGRSADLIVSDAGIIRKVVSEFGNVPDLRRVRLHLEGRTLELAIGRNGVITQAVFGESGRPGGAADALDGERVATLVHTPIEHRGRLIGHIELDETLAAIDAAIAWQISRIFLAFTALVLLSGCLIGLTVRSANRTIETQYEEIERTSQQLLQAAKLASVGELAGGLAHEINNPAGIIMTRADYVLAIGGQEGAAAEVSEGIKVIRNQAERISEIVRGLLTFSRPSQPRIRATDLNEVLQHTLMLVSPRWRAAGIRVTCCLEDRLPAVRADANQIGQVFVNVLNNAIDAMPQGGELSVCTGRDAPGMVFASIADTGCGIAEEHLPKVFDPFFTTKPPGKGTGLGLAISYGIVRNHGGEVRVASAAKRGATFTVLLPAKG